MNLNDAKTARKLAGIIAKLPGVQEMLKAEKERQHDEATAARVAVIERLEELAADEVMAQAAQVQALAEFEAVRVTYEAARAKMQAAEEAARAAAGLRRWVENELRLKHGEESVNVADSLLQTMRSQLETLIAGLERSEVRKTPLGRLEYVPAVREALEKERAKLEVVKSAFESLGDLRRARLHPAELSAQAEALLASAGYRPNVVKVEPAPVAELDD